MYSVYALIDPRDQAIRYIGMSNNVQRRFLQHIRGYTSNAANRSRDQWLASLKQDNTEPLVRVLETTDDFAQARLREKYWTEQYIHLSLTNAHILSDTGGIVNGRKGTLVYARRELCINQVELALISNVSQVIISRCERGHPICRHDAQVILDVLNAKIMERNGWWKNRLSWKPFTPDPLLHFSDLDWVVQGEGEEEEGE